MRDGNSEELWISSFVSFLLWRPGDFKKLLQAADFLISPLFANVNLVI